MAVYKHAYGPSDWSLKPLKLVEHHVYGSSRLGIVRRDVDVTSILNPKKTPVTEDLIGNTYVYTAERGWKLYELTNHLGNVLATVTDKKIGVPSSGNSSLIEYYNADVVSASDYYPFGMLMPGRKFESGEYRYGYNGKEMDNEVKGSGAQYDYGFRIYDPRIGKFLSMDPMFRGFAWNSTYAYAENDVIRSVDLDGLEKKIVISHKLDGEVTKAFEGTYHQLQTIDNKFAAPLVDQLVGADKRQSQFLGIQSIGTRTSTEKNWQGTTIKYFLKFTYTHDYLNEDDDLVHEGGAFELPIADLEVSSIWAPLTYVVLNKVTSTLITRVVNGASLLKGIQLVGAFAKKGNGQIQKLLRWAEAKKLGNTPHLVSSDYAAAAKATRAFTKRLGNRAIRELKELGYTKEDFIRFQGIYKNNIDKLKGLKKDTQVQEARLESVEKILKLWQ